MPAFLSSGPKEFGPKQLVALISHHLPQSAIHNALHKHGVAFGRKRKLPPTLLVRLIICLSLIRDASSRAVLASLLPPRTRPPNKGAICRARQELGPRPLMTLFHSMASPVATVQDMPQAFYKGLRLVALDATTTDVADTPENEKIFGRPKASRGKTAFPQARIIGLIECGTHLWLDALVRPYYRGEAPAARVIIERSVKAGQLLLYDRGLHGYEMLELIRRPAAHFLGRVKASIKLPVLEVLDDGSYLSEIRPGWRSRNRKGRVMRVRVITYKIGEKGEEIRLVTSLLDPVAYPAEELAALYHERWEIELVYDEVKTHQQGRPNGQAVGVRAQKPATVVQEIYGMLLAHQLVRLLMAASGLMHGIDPERLSYKNALIVVRRHMSGLSRARQAAPLF